jgi:hypothetical protein
MESDSVATSDAGVQGEAPQAVETVLPSITSTVSGLPISPAYAGAGMGTFTTRSSRTQHFRSSATRARPYLPPIKSENSYIPQRRGYAVEKNMIGDGDRVVDPLDNFKPQKFKESSEAGAGVEEHKPESPNKYRTSGKKAYRSENRANTEASSRKQLRYK